MCVGLSVATLRDLCPQDKVRVRGLVEQLAAVGEEKEQLAVAIKEDRAQFMQLLDKLKSEHNKVRVFANLKKFSVHTSLVDFFLLR